MDQGKNEYVVIELKRVVTPEQKRKFSFLILAMVFNIYFKESSCAPFLRCARWPAVLIWQMEVRTLYDGPQVLVYRYLELTCLRMLRVGVSGGGSLEAVLLRLSLRKRCLIDSTLISERFMSSWICMNACSCCITTELRAAFVSSDRLCEAPPSVICDVMGLANEYGVDRLKALCEDKLKRSANSENVCLILRRAAECQVRQARNMGRFWYQVIDV